MLSNLSPGISECDLPGSRPEDAEMEMIITFSQGEIDELRQYNQTQMHLPISQRHKLWAIVLNIIEQMNGTV